LAEQAAAVARIRQAALQDEAGQALDQALLQHGAPARPVKAQPVLWMKNPRLKKT
jgi:indolepyruvate ferredoxin oxidoreductase beta subunit